MNKKTGVAKAPGGQQQTLHGLKYRQLCLRISTNEHGMHFFQEFRSACYEVEDMGAGDGLWQMIIIRKTKKPIMNNQMFFK